MTAIRLYVDDLRKCPEGWVLARTNSQAIYYLHHHDVEAISIDHDICFYSRAKHIIQEVEETFRPIAYYLAVMPAERRPKTIVLHSANPAGAHDMQVILRKAGVDCEVQLGKPIMVDEVLSDYGH